MNPEAAVIGSILLSSGEALDQINLNPEDFLNPQLSRVFGTLRKMRQANEAIDPITLIAKHPEHNIDIFDWQSETPTWENVGFYCELVKDAAVLRGMRVTGEKLMKTAEVEDLDQIIDESRRELGQLAERRTTAKIEYLSDIALGHFDTMGQPRTFTESPWVLLNKAIQGFRPGALYVIGARPGVGKTVVGLQLAFHLGKSGPVSFHSLEMSKPELLNRIYSMTSSVYLGNIDKGDIKKRDWDALATARAEISSSNLVVIDKSGQSINDIRANARTLQQNGGLKAIVVDYLGLIRDTIPNRKRYEAISDFSVALKNMARDFDVPVIALAQLNRQSEGRTDKSPMLSDLRDSGAIEQDADVVMLLSRHKLQNDRDWESSGFVIDVAKNRHGMTGELNLIFNGGCARVEEPR